MAELKDISTTARQIIATEIGSSDRYLQQLQVGRRKASAAKAIAIEKAATKLNLNIPRESLCEACSGCELAKKARKGR